MIKVNELYKAHANPAKRVENSWRRWINPPEVVYVLAIYEDDGRSYMALQTTDGPMSIETRCFFEAVAVEDLVGYSDACRIQEELNERNSK
jgi:hypothetical protein